MALLKGRSDHLDGFAALYTNSNPWSSTAQLQLSIAEISKRERAVRYDMRRDLGNKSLGYESLVVSRAAT